MFLCDSIAHSELLKMNVIGLEEIKRVLFKLHSVTVNTVKKKQYFVFPISHHKHVHHSFVIEGTRDWIVRVF